MNPFLPLWEYTPDGEPHIFGDRIYLFGSHDTEGGDRYCSNAPDVVQGKDDRYYLYYTLPAQRRSI